MAPFRRNQHDAHYSHGSGSASWLKKNPFAVDLIRHRYYRNLAEACADENTGPLTGRPLNLAQMTAQSWPRKLPSFFPLLRLVTAGRQYTIPAEMLLQLKELYKHVRASTGNSSFTAGLSDPARGPLKIDRPYAEAADKELGLTNSQFRIQDSFAEIEDDDDGPGDVLAAVTAGLHTDGVDGWLVAPMLPLVNVAVENRSSVFDRLFVTAADVQSVFEQQIQVLDAADYNEEGSDNYNPDRPIVKRFTAANGNRANRKSYLLELLQNLSKGSKAPGVSKITVPSKTTSSDASALRAASNYEANVRYLASEVTRLTCGAVNPASDPRWMTLRLQASELPIATVLMLDKLSQEIRDTWDTILAMAEYSNRSDTLNRLATALSAGGAVGREIQRYVDNDISLFELAFAIPHIDTVAAWKLGEVYQEQTRPYPSQIAASAFSSVSVHVYSNRLVKVNPLIKALACAVSECKFYNHDADSEDVCTVLGLEVKKALEKGKVLESDFLTTEAQTFFSTFFEKTSDDSYSKADLDSIVKHLKVMDERVARYESSLSVDDTESSMELMALRRDTKFEVSSGARRFMDRQNSTLASVEVEDKNDGKENKRKYTEAFSPEDWSDLPDEARKIQDPEEVCCNELLQGRTCSAETIVSLPFKSKGQSKVVYYKGPCWRRHQMEDAKQQRRPSKKDNDAILKFAKGPQRGKNKGKPRVLDEAKCVKRGFTPGTLNQLFRNSGPSSPHAAALTTEPLKFNMSKAFPDGVTDVLFLKYWKTECQPLGLSPEEAWNRLNK